MEPFEPLTLASMPRRKPRCIVIAGPNGAGKTTFAREFLPREAGILNFVNADLIAAGLSPLFPSAAQMAAARIYLEELDRLAAERSDFAFETTLSGRAYVERIKAWRKAGYRVEVVFLKLPEVSMALRRVANRVKQGGHHVPEADVRRRFVRGWHNFEAVYKGLADAWAVYDNQGHKPVFIDGSHG
jgi:predicted ABC-type ATPase